MYYNIIYYLGESGGNKSNVDMNFGLCKSEISRGVKECTGKLDITCPRTLARALNYKNIFGQISYAAHVARSEATEPKLNTKIVNAKLQSRSTRIYQYNEIDKTPISVTLYEQSYLGANPKVVPIPQAWEKVTSINNIIPTAHKLPPLPPPDMGNNASQMIGNIPSIHVLINNATANQTTRKEKDDMQSDRRKSAEEKLLAAKASQEEIDENWSQQITRIAEIRGIKSYIHCSTNGNLNDENIYIYIYIYIYICIYI
jgi:hypothetical protein